jgi:hypothetical protein
MAVREAVRYLVASLALGMIGYWGSEALFWSFRPDDATALAIVATILAYALASACVLSAVSWAGIGGWRAAFFGGALLGFLVEGVVVATIYDAFPAQLVWTPLAWHALVTGLAVLALHLAAVGWRVWRQVSTMMALGAFGGLFSAYWPIERAILPGPADIAAYQLGTGGIAVAGFALLRAVAQVPRPAKWVLWGVPVLAVLLFLLQTAADPRPERLALPVVVGLTLWAMVRLGTAGGAVRFGGDAPVWRHGLFLIAPLVTTLIAAGMVRGTAGWETNVVVALTAGPAGLGLWLWLLWRAVRPGKAAPSRSA